MKLLSDVTLRSLEEAYALLEQHGVIERTLHIREDVARELIRLAKLGEQSLSRVLPDKSENPNEH